MPTYSTNKKNASRFRSPTALRAHPCSCEYRARSLFHRNQPSHFRRYSLLLLLLPPTLLLHFHYHTVCFSPAPATLSRLQHFTSIVGVMGTFKNSRLAAFVGWTISLTIIAMNVYLVYVTFQSFGLVKWAIGLVVTASIIYVIFVFYLMLGPVLHIGSLRHLYKVGGSITCLVWGCGATSLSIVRRVD